MIPKRPASRARIDNSGRVALVTGGSAGIGNAICHAFRDSGALGVVAMDVNEPKTPFPPEIHFFQGDVSDPSQCQAAVDWVMNKYGALDVLVNNASIQPPSSYVRLDQLSPEMWDKLIGINFTGYTNMARAAVKPMLAQQSGVIINISSEQGHRTARQVPAYGPIKAGNIMQARQWGIEYARDGIRVLCVSPGAIETPLLKASLEAQGGSEQLAQRHPLGRLGRPEEVSNVVLWLASDAASFITATDLAVDGGLNAYGAFADPYPTRA